jgi:hypothetical protein
MAGLMGFVAAGAMEGVGKGLVDMAKAEREERMKELDRQHQIKRDEAGRAFSREEYAKDRALRRDESAADRGFRAGEGQKDRDFRLGLTREEHGFRSGEAEKDRGFRSGETDKDRSFRKDEAHESRVHQSTERAIDRRERREESEKDRAPATLVDEGGYQIERPRGGGAYKRSKTEDGQDVRPGRTSATWDSHTSLSPTQIGTRMSQASENVDKTETSGGDKLHAIHREKGRLQAAGVPLVEVRKWAENELRGYAQEKKVGNADQFMRQSLSSMGFKDAENGPAPAASAPSAPSARTGLGGGGQAQAAPASAERKPPAQYPDAKWSDRAGGWVVQRDGKWHLVRQ